MEGRREGERREGKKERRKEKNEREKIQCTVLAQAMECRHGWIQKLK